MTDEYHAPSEARVDWIWTDGCHDYWSTHCRHGNAEPPWDDRHGACNATELAPGVPRQPAQCKTCAAPCICDCHGPREERETHP